ncbi:MAG: hypothetical protein QOI82_955 [Actinomycetota bacterium]|jgi:multisubunit Na+/H+ antiporter MnhG subunit|nr:hypothetical protein [Actinomycetota bacterium]
MKPVSKTVGVSFLLALVGVVFLLALVVKVLLGLIALVLFALLLVLPAAHSIRKARRRRARLTAGRTCTCCTGSVHDPVQVV